MWNSGPEPLFRLAGHLLCWFTQVSGGEEGKATEAYRGQRTEMDSVCPLDFGNLVNYIKSIHVIFHTRHNYLVDCCSLFFYL